MVIRTGSSVSPAAFSRVPLREEVKKPLAPLAKGQYAPHINEDIIKDKWLNKKAWAELESATDGTLPDDVLCHATTLTLYHCDEGINNGEVFPVFNEVVQLAISRDAEMKKEDLFALFSQGFFFNASHLVFCYGDDEFSKSRTGHWYVFVVDLNKDSIYAFDTAGVFKGVDTITSRIKTTLVSPFLRYRASLKAPLDKPQRGKVETSFALT